MKAFTPLLLLLVSIAVQAGDAFNDRVERAKALEETPSGQAYQDVMWPKVQPFVAALMQRCIPDDRNADRRSFVFVATLSAEAKLTEIEVQPVTETSKCFAAGMERAPFPKPPATLAPGGMPITFNMRLHEMN
jgi:hypothetical protein